MSKGKIPVTLVREADDPVVREVFERLGQGAVGVVNIHRTLAKSPQVFAAFIAFAHALRFQTEIDPLARELAILRVLTKHGGHYEAAHHRRMALAAGASEAQVAGAAAGEVDPALYDERLAAILRYADAFAAGEGVDGETARALAPHLDDRRLVELTLTLGLYLGLAHLTNALDVPAD